MTARAAHLNDRRRFITLLAAAGAGLSFTARANAKPRFVAHAIPTANARPYIIIPGPDGHAWFAESGGNKVGCLRSDTRTIVEFAVPTPNSRPIGMIAGGDG